MKRIAILALQGAFAEHERMLQYLGAETTQIRNLADWNAFLGESPETGDYSGKGLVIPGGESTAMMRIMRDEKLFVPLQAAIRGGLPVFGTRSEEHTSELQSPDHLVCRLLLEK